MEAGNLDWRIKIERYTEDRDEFNALIKTWGTLMNVWASRLDISDAERIAAQEAGSTITTRFQIRWTPTADGITARDRVNIDGQLFDITGVKFIGTREGVELTTTLRNDLTS